MSPVSENKNKSPRMGRIGYLNVLPIYHPLESGIIPHEFELVSGAPSHLNQLMREGKLHLSSCSCIEYAKHPGKYLILKDLSIASRGPVLSVLLLSRLPAQDLAGREILISGQSNTSVELLKILMRELYKISPNYRTGQVESAINSGNTPDACLVIGDEALRLRDHPAFPWRVDLAEAWRSLTGLPFVFALWIIDRKSAEEGFFKSDPGKLLRKGRDWGLEHIEKIVDLAAKNVPLSREELFDYYTKNLMYSLGPEEQTGLELFYQKLAETWPGMTKAELRFY